MAASQMKVPALVMIAVVCLGLGAAAGVAVVMVYGNEARPELPARAFSARAKATIAQETAQQKKLDEGAAKTPAKANLAALVVKLDQLLPAPLRLDLDKKQRQQIVEQLKGLAELEMLPEEQALVKLAALQNVLKPNEQVLKAAGVLWTDELSVQEKTRSSRNPFQMDEIRRHLRSLERQLR